MLGGDDYCEVTTLRRNNLELKKAFDARGRILELLAAENANLRERIAVLERERDWARDRDDTLE